MQSVSRNVSASLRMMRNSASQQRFQSKGDSDEGDWPLIVPTVKVDGCYQVNMEISKCTVPREVGPKRQDFSVKDLSQHQSSHHVYIRFL